MVWDGTAESGAQVQPPAPGFQYERPGQITRRLSLALPAPMMVKPSASGTRPRALIGTSVDPQTQEVIEVIVDGARRRSRRWSPDRMAASSAEPTATG